MARKSKAVSKPKPLVSGQQTLFSALGVKPSATGLKRARSSECLPEGEQTDTAAGEELLRRTSADSGAQPAAAGDATSTRLSLAQRSSDTQAAQQRRVADVLLVMDFEATCDRQSQMQPQELIEFSSCLLNASSMVVEAEFQQYVQPTEHPFLNAFTQQLTGITQNQYGPSYIARSEAPPVPEAEKAVHRVDCGMSLSDTLHQHDAWLRQHGIHPGGRSCLPVTWTDWDLKKQLDQECKWRKITVPPYLRRWHDLRKSAQAFGGAGGGLKGALKGAGLEWEGRAHSGLDDARNTARLAMHYMQQGAVIDVTGAFEDCTLPGMSGRQGVLFPLRMKKACTVDRSGNWNGNCECGVKAKLCKSGKPGPFLGRQFWGCGTWTILKGRGDCNLFKWADET